jgi:hypothetical protein
MKQKKLFFVEYTDQFGGEANYSWCTRWIVSASTERGALRKVSPVFYRHDWGNKFVSVSGATCFFVDEVDSEEAERIESQYTRIERV